MANESPNGALSVNQARQRLGGISQATFYALINSGQLRSFQIGKRRLISEQAIADYIESRERATRNSG